MKIGRIRGFVALVFAVGIPVLGLSFQSGAGSLSAFGLDAVAALCPVGALESMLGAKSVSVHGLVCLAITVVVVVVVGKAFCAWACPVPWLQGFFRPGRKGSDEHADAGGHAAACSCDEPIERCCEPEAATPAASMKAELLELGASVEGEPPKGNAPAEGDEGIAPVGGDRDGVQLDSRHVVLGTALASTALFGFPVFCLVCPVGLSFATLAAVWHLLQFNETTWGLVAFPLVLVLEVVFLRKWCFSFCPISALASFVSRLNVTLKPKVDKKTCLRSKGVDCRACVSACPERVDPHSSVIPECSKCHECVDACPAKAIAFRLLN